MKEKIGYGIALIVILVLGLGFAAYGFRMYTLGQLTGKDLVLCVLISFLNLYNAPWYFERWCES